MKRKWRPNATQRREFAERMKDPAEKAAYEARKEDKARKRREGSKFDYTSAGGMYVPTKVQYDYAMKFFHTLEDIEPDQRDACNQVISGYVCQEKVHHDYIHIVNELIRRN